MSMSSSIWEKFRDPRYRHALVAETLRRTVPAQIKAMRKKREISQAELAERAGLTQGVVSRAENPGYGKLTFATVLRIAAGLDVAFVGRFVPFSEFQKLFDTTSDRPIRLTREEVASFEEENAASEVVSVLPQVQGASVPPQQSNEGESQERKIAKIYQFPQQKPRIPLPLGVTDELRSQAEQRR